MIIIDYKARFHKKIISVCVRALKQGKTVVYPTDTCYGLAVDAANINAIRRLYKIKGRDFKKPVHVVVPSVIYAKKIIKWNSMASRLAKRYLPGPLTFVLPLRIKDKGLGILSAKSGYMGIRFPDNRIALDLSRLLKQPITATSANRSGQPDCYSSDDIIRQFKYSKTKPDIIINSGKLPKRKSSTIVKIDGNQVSILRQGPVRLSKVLFAKLGKEHL